MLNKSIYSKLELFVERCEEIELLLSQAEIIQQQDKFVLLNQEYNQLLNVVRPFLEYRALLADKNENVALLVNEKDSSLIEMIKEDLKQIDVDLIALDEQLNLLMVPKGEKDDHNCFLEIRAGAGGDEAAIFAGDLYRMYIRYLEDKNWSVDVLSQNESEHGGFKEIILKVSGYGAYGSLKFESGGHRVQRVPETESQGRVHTSACTVGVLPEIPESEFPDIKTADLRIDTFRASGAGGQHVNKTDSAIRITHLPSGLVVECQEERSQHKNKAKALSVLHARLAQLEEDKRNKEEAAVRKGLLGTGDRSDRIRTYNFPQSRLTDHRINLTLYRLNEVLDGNLDLVIQALLKEYQADLLAQLSE